MKLIALFNNKRNINIENHLGYNLYQRQHYVKRLELLPTSELKSYAILFYYLLKDDEKMCLVTERNVFSLLGYIFRTVSSNKYWIVDLQDCPFKETTSRYKRGTLKWLLSWAKSKLLYSAITYADEIVISYSPTRFFEFYKGNKSKVHFFKNALPSLKSKHYPALPKFKEKIRIVYVGASLQGYGIELLEEVVCEDNLIDRLNVELHIYGCERGDKRENSHVHYHGKCSRHEVISAISKSHVCVAPFEKGTDIEFTYPIKALEYYCYGRKLLLSNCVGMLEMFSGVCSTDIYYFEAGDIKSLRDTLVLCVKDLVAGILDTERNISSFSAELKNKRISEIYYGVFNENIESDAY